MKKIVYLLLITSTIISLQGQIIPKASAIPKSLGDIDEIAKDIVAKAEDLEKKAYNAILDQNITEAKKAAEEAGKNVKQAQQLTKKASELFAKKTLDQYKHDAIKEVEDIANEAWTKAKNAVRTIYK